MNDYYIEQSKAHLLLCPLDRTGDYHVGKKCAGPLCMGWVHELDDNEKPTGRGRCGMVLPVMPVYTCTTAPEYDGSMPIMDWKKYYGV